MKQWIVVFVFLLIAACSDENADEIGIGGECIASKDCTTNDMV